MQLVKDGIAEQQKSLVRPHRPFSKMQAIHHSLDFYVTEVLRKTGGR
jgi:hypothetical protein